MMKPLPKLFGAPFFISLVAILFVPLQNSAQVFWTEDFNNGCSANCDALAYAGPNGAWTQTVTGAEGADPNMWYVSCAENGHTPTVCGSGCVAASATATLATLHVGSNPNSLGDIGAAYDAGGLCGFWTCPQTNRRIESPVINCTGKTNITLAFNYIENGDGTLDDASVWYFDGATWALLSNMAKTLTNCSGGQGRWTGFSMALPASADNNPNVKIGFLWINNDDGVGTDPSFAVDDVTLSTPSSGAPVAAFTASATTICAGQGVNFTDNSTGAPTSWSWTFPSGTPGTSGSQNPSGITWSTAGTYTVTLTATNSNGSSSSTVVITVNASPTVTATANPASICNGQQVTLTSSGATTYLWNPGNVGGSSVSVSPTSTTTYTVTGTSAGCTDTAQITVVVNPIPTVTAVANPATICIGQTTSLTAGGASTYNWMPGNFSGSPVTDSPAVTTTYTVTGTTAAGCTSTQTVTVTVQSCSAPLVNFTASDTAICVGDCIDFTDLSLNNPTSWNWTFAGAATGTSTAQNPTNICYNAPGTFAVTLIASNSNGPGTLTKTGYIVVNPPPAANAGPDATICIGQQTTLLGSGGGTYLWMPGNLTSANPVVTPTVTTTYSLTVTDATGCTASDQVTITVTTCAPPVAAFTASDNMICESTCIDFTDLSSGSPSAWSWSFPGGMPSTSSAQNPTGICYNTPGVYTVTLIVTNAFGTDTIIVSNSVSVGAQATINAGIDTSIAIGNSVVLTATGGSGTYTWSGPGIGNPNSASQNVSPMDTTVYTVTYTDAYGCTSTDDVTVFVVEAYAIFIPSAFSPNGDGHNETLFVRGAGIKNMTFMVFDRFGEKVFESSSVDDGWDGTFRGKPMNSGIFVYVVTVEFYDGTSQVLKGDVSLVR
jgi:gliding motility-associated-like protein